MSTAKLIFNPQSDHGRSYQTAGDLRHLGDEIGGTAWVGTEYPGHAVALARQAALSGHDPVVAIGGDGTVHEVINGLMQVEASRRPRLGIVPVGSGNDFAIGAGIELKPLEALRRILSRGEARPIDIGMLRDESGRLEHWDNTVGIGFDAAVNLQSRSIKRVHGFLMYLLAVIKVIIQNYDAARMDIEIDGEKRSAEVLMFTVGNGPREGGGFVTTPNSRIDDGVLEYATVDRISRLMMLRLIPEVMNGTHGRFRQVKMGTLHSLRIRADRPLPIHMDGEMYATYEANVRGVEIAILPGAVRLVA